MTRVCISIDPELMEKITREHPDIDIRKFLKEQVAGLVGIRVRCSKCSYSWIYTGSGNRIKCNRCNHHIRVRRPSIQDD